MDEEIKGILLNIVLCACLTSIGFFMFAFLWYSPERYTLPSQSTQKDRYSEVESSNIFQYVLSLTKIVLMPNRPVLAQIYGIENISYLLFIKYYLCGSISCFILMAIAQEVFIILHGSRKHTFIARVFGEIDFYKTYHTASLTTSTLIMTICFMTTNYMLAKRQKELIDKDLEMICDNTNRRREMAYSTALLSLTPNNNLDILKVCKFLELMDYGRAKGARIFAIRQVKDFSKIGYTLSDIDAEKGYFETPAIRTYACLFGKW